jgi:hypothetical protein
MERPSLKLRGARFSEGCGIRFSKGEDVRPLPFLAHLGCMSYQKEKKAGVQVPDMEAQKLTWLFTREQGHTYMTSGTYLDICPALATVTAGLHLTVR